LPQRIDAALDAFLLDEAAAAIVELVDAANQHIERTAPWRLARTEPDAAARALVPPIDAARVAIAELAPFVPRLAAALAARVQAPLREGPPPVPRRKVT
jgi:methionyl-tRNA synthetase